MHHFCTISSGNFLPFVETLFASLQEQDRHVVLHVLMTDKNFNAPEKNGLLFYTVDDLVADRLIEQIEHQYRQHNNHLRWTLKPAFLHYLLQREEKAIYVDNDISFFGSFHFLFDLLSAHSILLTPHWFCLHPYPYPENFETNFQIGLFNAGFVGASKGGMPFLRWWAEACLYRMERNVSKGLYDDQRYLDLAFLIDEKVGIIRHSGCNLGSWNMHQNRRTTINGEVRINGTDPVVFIHFNHETVKHISNGNDGALKPFFDRYVARFAATGHQLQDFIGQLQEWKQQTPIQALARKTKVRTRIKSWLFRLSQKL